MRELLKEIRSCTVCAPYLEHGPRPVLTAHAESRIVVVGQAPGMAVHRSGIPWDDKSGENLRTWMGISSDDFYDERKVALVPTGFCYPGKGKSGDLPPRKECAPLWHRKVFDDMTNVRLTMLVGSYAQGYYLGDNKKKTLTETVRSYREYLPEYFVLPHPSPRNNIWRAKNPWFDEEVIPALQQAVARELQDQL